MEGSDIVNFLIKKLKEKWRDEFAPQICVLQMYRPIFTTTDGKEHYGVTYKYADSSHLSVSVPECIMIHIEDKGYIKDDDEIMYPLQNVTSIRWELVDEKIKQCYSGEYRFQIFFDDEEVEDMKDYKAT